MTDLYSVISYLNDRYGGRPLRSEERMTEMIRRDCEELGVPVREIVWSDGQFGRVGGPYEKGMAQRMAIQHAREANAAQNAAPPAVTVAGETA